MRRFTSLAAVLGFAVFSLAQFAWADTSDYGHYSQLNGDTDANDYQNASITPDANGNPRAPQACAPTATANSFEMLQNRYGVTGLIDPLDPYGSISDLADAMGTTGDEFFNPASPGYHMLDGDGNEVHTGGTFPIAGVNGKVDYINANQTGGPAIEVHGQSIYGSFGPDGKLTAGPGTIPTAEYLKEQLDAGQDVEIWQLWWDPTDEVYKGGHVITATDIDLTLGTIEFVDLWGESGTAVDVEGTFDMHGSYVQIHYPLPEGGEDPDNPDNPGVEAQADIAMIVAESPVPEPATIGIFCLGMTLMLRRRRAA
jgi:hypothetical protein